MGRNRVGFALVKMANLSCISCHGSGVCRLPAQSKQYCVIESATCYLTAVQAVMLLVLADSLLHQSNVVLLILHNIVLQQASKNMHMYIYSMAHYSTAHASTE